VVFKYLALKGVSNQYLNQSQINPEIYLLNGNIKLLSNKVVVFDCIIKCKNNSKCSIDFRIKTKDGIPFGFGSYGTFSSYELLELKEGDNEFAFQFDVNSWAIGKYYLSIDLTLPDIKYYERQENILMFEIVRNPDEDRRCLDLNWNYGPLQIKITKNIN
jgi:lipopolysaccharide transport system ATP-binding protein